MILALRMILWTGMHKTFQEANIFRDNRRHFGVFATYIGIWRAGGRLC